ncbi:hypothetical protein [Actinomyces oris]|jgi:hypothetical protein
MATEWWNYVQSLIGDNSFKEAADRAGFDKSAFTRRKRGAKPDPAFAFAVALARWYHTNLVEAPVAAGLITDGEANMTTVHLGVREALCEASGRSLLEEIAGRLELRAQGMPADDVAPVLSLRPGTPPPQPLTVAAARTVAHRPEWEAEKVRRSREASELRDVESTPSGD